MLKDNLIYHYMKNLFIFIYPCIVYKTFQRQIEIFRRIHKQIHSMS